MDKSPNWEAILKYHEIPCFTPNGFYLIKYNKIYIHDLVRSYPEYHKFILEHEKEHYNNHNSNDGFIKEIIKDIMTEWKGTYMIYKNKKLYNEKKLFIKEKIRNELDFQTRIHYTVVKYLRPEYIVIWIPLILIVRIIINIHGIF